MDSSPQAAQHFGVRKHFEMPGIKLSIVQTQNSDNSVGWHYHETPHLTFILRGDVIEGTEKEVLHCSAGELLFHGGFEPHYNRESEGNATCLHIDFAQGYLDEFAPRRNRLQGIFGIRNPGIKFSCYKLFSEATISDDLSEPSIQGLSLEILWQLFAAEEMASIPRPSWVGRLEEILRCRYSEKLPLEQLARELNIHPVHLSRSFSRYFQCTLGEYVRKLRVERSLAFISRRSLSLTEVAVTCGFADQSHYIRSFKEIMGVTPSTYRKLLRG
jgi:AraC family transcriptional regulator